MTTSRRLRTAARPASATPRLSYLVFRLERRIRAHLDDALARHGITTTEYMALSELRLRDRPSSAQLARIAFVTAQAMNVVIRDLEQRGLVQRRPDPRGGRVLRVGLTRAGSTTLRRCDRALDEIEQVMLAALADEDRKTLADQLAECARALHPEPDPEPDPDPAADRP
ncbi:MAG: MarR family winged helix-turn-helix transcriptional regulator [Catenulispora sp.]